MTAPTTAASGVAIRSLRELAGLSTADVAQLVRKPVDLIERVESGISHPPLTWVSSVVTLIAIEMSRHGRFSEKMAALVTPASTASFSDVAVGAALGHSWSRQAEGWLGLAASTTSHATAPYVFRRIAELVADGAEVHLYTGSQAVPRSAWSGAVFAEFGRPASNEYWRDAISIGSAASFHEVVVQLAQLVETNPAVGTPSRFGPPAARCEAWCTRHYVQWDMCTRPMGKLTPAAVKSPVRVVLRRDRTHGIPRETPDVIVSGPTTRMSTEEREWIDSLTHEALAIAPTAVAR